MYSVKLPHRPYRIFVWEFSVNLRLFIRDFGRSNTLRGESSVIRQFRAHIARVPFHFIKHSLCMLPF